MNWLVLTAILAAGAASFLSIAADWPRVWATEPDDTPGMLVRVAIGVAFRATWLKG